MQEFSPYNQDMSLKDRVKQLRKENHYSQVELAKKLDVSQSVISLIESGNASISLDILKKLSHLFDKSCDWLIYGKGEYTKLSTDNAFIPLISIEAKAGYIDNYNESDFVEALDLYKIPGFENGRYRIFEVEGDSMVPTIFSHDKIICECIEDPHGMIEGTLNVVITKKDILVKRVYYSHEDSSKLILKSDNRDYKEMLLKLEDVLEIWEVKAKLTNSFISQSYEQTSRLDKLENEIQQMKDQVKSLISKINGQL